MRRPARSLIAGDPADDHACVVVGQQVALCHVPGGQVDLIDVEREGAEVVALGLAEERPGPLRPRRPGVLHEPSGGGRGGVRCDARDGACSRPASRPVASLAPPTGRRASLSVTDAAAPSSVGALARRRSRGRHLDDEVVGREHDGADRRTRGELREVHAVRELDRDELALVAVAALHDDARLTRGGSHAHHTEAKGAQLVLLRRLLRGDGIGARLQRSVRLPRRVRLRSACW